MRPSTLLASGVASLLALSPLPSHAGTEDHFILTRVSTLGHFRYDPIVNPGGVSGHVHNILGASCFNNVPNTPEQQQACDCSSAIIGDDRSNYWSPTLYYQFKNGSLSPILGGNRIYYFLKSKDIKPFPPGLRMISGLPTRRDVSDYKAMGVRISCNTAAGEGVETAFLPNKTSHPNGCSSVALAVYFPSCGLADGSLDSADHFSHMAWPIKRLGGGSEPFDDVNGWECPESHPVKYPTVFLHANYYFTPKEMPWDHDNPVVLSNGDQSGNTYHGDFFNGWKQETMQATLDQCGKGKGPGEHLEECAPLAKSMNEEKTWWCRYQNQIPNEDVGLYRPIPQLPGCNKIWPTDGPDTKPPCEEEAPPTTIYPNTEFENLSYRMRLPLLFTLANDTNNATEMAKFVPALGVKGASRVKTYGVGASNQDSLTLSTVEEILAAPGEPMQILSAGQSGGLGNGTVSDTNQTSVVNETVSGSNQTSVFDGTVKGTNATSVSPLPSNSTSVSASDTVATSAIANAGVHLAEGGGIAAPASDSPPGSSPTISLRATSFGPTYPASSAASHGPTYPASVPTAAGATPTDTEDVGPISTATGSAKTCKRKKRAAEATCQNKSLEVQRHLHRRSRQTHRHGH